MEIDEHDETFKWLSHKCARGFYDLLMLTRQQDESELPFDFKIVDEESYIPGEGVFSEFASTINKYGWHQMTYCDEGGFFSGSQMVYERKN